MFTIFVLDIPIYYNFKTNEIIGDGIYMLHPEIKSLSINALNTFKLLLEEEQFIKLNNPKFQVQSSLLYIIYDLYYLKWFSE